MTSIFKTLGLDSFSSVLRKLFCSQSASVCLSTIFAGTYRMNLKSLKFVSMDLHLHTKSLKLQYKSIVKKLSHGNLYLKHARSNWLNSFVFICRSSSFLMQWTLTQYLGIFHFLCILINWHCRQRTGIAPSDMIKGKYPHILKCIFINVDWDCSGWIFFMMGHIKYRISVFIWCQFCRLYINISHRW